MSHYLIPDWPAPERVKAYSTLRFNGNSLAPYEHFNLGFATGDDPNAVSANRQQLINELELRQAPAWIKQVHGVNVVQAETVTDERPEADASYASLPGIVCVVLTADCLPILLCNEQGDQVAAIHAGWRGLHQGVIANTVAQLKAPAEHWLAWLGPGIGPASFAVGNEVREQFLAKDPQTASAFKPIGPNAWLGDLYAIARQQLAKLNIHRIYGGDFDTYTNAVNFYSHRRDQGRTGRMASLIWFT